MDIESTLNNMLFFSTVKNGQFDYTTPLKSSLISFDTDKKTEPSPPLLEYLCYKLVKKKLLEGKANTEIILMTENFLTSLHKKNIILNTSVIDKKHIIIFLQSIKTGKWNLIGFLNLEQQLKDCFDQNSKKPLLAKIISSNLSSEEDDYILNTTMDKLENTFNFISPDDIQFEVDSINISDQPNISIFLLNFLEGLIEQNDNDMITYIQKLYTEGSNNITENCVKYFSSFNEVKEDFLNLYSKYQNELKEYIKNNPNLEVEKIMNGNDEILNIENNNNNKGYIVEGNEAMVNGMSKMNIKSEKNDDIDMIKIEKDDDIDEDEINSEEEEEALKIMEKESKESKSQIKNQKRKLNQRLYQQKLRLKNLDMYREFGVIKEEDNESESESIDIFNKMKEEVKAKKILNDSKKFRKNKDGNKNKVNKKINGIENENNKVLNIVNGNKELAKESLQNENINDSGKRSKSDKVIKLSVLKELEQAIEEFELEQEPSTKSIEYKITNCNNIFEDKKYTNKNNKSNNRESNNNETKNNALIVNENKENIIFKKNSEKNMNNSDMNKINIKSGHIRKSTSEKKGSINLNINKKNLNPALKSKDKDKDKENYKIIKNSNSVTKKAKSEREKENNNNLPKNKEHNNEIKITQTNKSSNSNKSKEKDSNSTNYNSPIIYNTNSYHSFNSNSNSNKSHNEIEKNSKDKDNKKGRKREPMDSLSKKISNAKVIFNNVKKKKSKINSKHKKIKNNSGNNSHNLPAISIMSLIDGTYKSSNIKLDEPPLSQRNCNKNKHSKASEKKYNKSKKILSPIESPMNVLPPQKIVERNGLYDLQAINRDEKFAFSLSPKYKIFNFHSVQSEKNNGDFNNNINIENILSDEFEYGKEKNGKNEFNEEGSPAGDNRTKKTMVKRGDKKMKPTIPPGKTKISNKSYKDQYCNYYEEGESKAYGCIGEQANQLCLIF